MKEKDFIEFARMVGKLKSIKRAGWVDRKVTNPESVADHSFRATLIGMILSDLEKLNTEKVMRMLILHDIEESVTGDIMAIDKVKMNKEELHNNQIRAIEKILSPLPESLKKSYISIWKEMEEGLTQEAKFCKDVDKLEMMIQTDDYEREDVSNKEKLRPFWSRELRDINIPKRVDSIIKIYKELEKERGIK
jgi:putative hydrolase of HD superfamily